MTTFGLDQVTALEMGSPTPTASVADPTSRDETVRLSKIMIIDDEPINVKVARKYLKLEGYENFVQTTDSREAMAIVEKERPDVILLDIMMPHVSGLDILAALAPTRGGSTFRSSS